MDTIGISIAVNRLKNAVDEEKITLSNIDSTLESIDSTFEELVDEIHLMNQLLAQIIKNNNINN